MVVSWPTPQCWLPGTVSGHEALYPNGYCNHWELSVGQGVRVSGWWFPTVCHDGGAAERGNWVIIKTILIFHLRLQVSTQWNFMAIMESAPKPYHRLGRGAPPQTKDLTSCPAFLTAFDTLIVHVPLNVCLTNTQGRCSVVGYCY